MSNDDKTPKEKYRGKTKRVSVWKPEYEVAEQYVFDRGGYSFGSGDNIPAIAEKPNRVIAESFMMAMGTDDYDVGWLDRVLLFAEKNDLDKEEAIETIICKVLDDSGHIEETFRKPRLFPNDMW